MFSEEKKWIDVVTNCGRFFKDFGSLKQSVYYQVQEIIQKNIKTIPKPYKTAAAQKTNT